MNVIIKEGPLRRPQLSQIETAHWCCIAQLMTLAPKKIIGNGDRFDVLEQADCLDAVTAYTKAVVAHIGKEFPIGFIEDETDRLAEAADDVAGALKDAVDTLIEVEVA